MKFNWCETNLNIGCGEYKYDHCEMCNIARAYQHGYEIAKEDAPTIVGGDLISRKWLLDLYETPKDGDGVDWKVPLEVVRQNIKDAPSADSVSREDTVTLNSPISIQAEMVAVVRCKDCRHGYKQIKHNGELFYECDLSECEEWFTENFFCANGERRDP